MGDEVTYSALSFINGVCSLGELNNTNISLIPKVKNPTRISEFKPISLCNVRYKIISKILASRLQRVIPYVIGEVQSAFVKGRLITDNVIVENEVFHWLKQKRDSQDKFFGKIRHE